MKRFLLTLTVLFSAIFSLVAKPVPTDFGEKVHIGVIGQNAPILHQVDESTSVELQWVTQDNYLYDAIGSPVRPGSGRASFDDIANNGVRNDLAVGGVRVQPKLAPKPKSIANRNLTKAEYQALNRAERLADPGTTWNTARRNYWKAVGEAELANISGKFSRQNIARMTRGLAPRIKARVRYNKSGREVTQNISMELHHKFLFQRGGGKAAHQHWNLERATPWGHDSMDPFRHTGYEVLEILKGTHNWR